MHTPAVLLSVAALAALAAPGIAPMSAACAAEPPLTRERASAFARVSS